MRQLGAALHGQSTTRIGLTNSCPSRSRSLPVTMTQSFAPAIVATIISCALRGKAKDFKARKAASGQTGPVIQQGSLLRVLGHGQILDYFQQHSLRNSDDQQVVAGCGAVTALHLGKRSLPSPGPAMPALFEEGLTVPLHTVCRADELAVGKIKAFDAGVSRRSCCIT